MNEPGTARTGLTTKAMVAIGVGAALAIGIPVALLVGGGGDPSGPEASVAPSTTATATPEASGSPTREGETELGGGWAELASDQRPPLLTGQDGREPQAREMQDWVWDYVDDSWAVEIVGEVEAYYDDTEVTNPFQTLFLVAPDGEYFRLYTLRTDIPVIVYHFVPGERLVFLGRVFFGEDWQTVALNLVSGEVDENWAATGFVGDYEEAAANREGWFVFYQATLADGRELWTGQGFGSPISGVFFRTPGGGIDSSEVGLGLRPRQTYCIGVDADDMVAVYDIQDYAYDTETWSASFITHDLAADTWTVTDRMGFIPTACHEEFDVTDEYWVGLGNSIEQEGLYRVYFDGRPDEAIS